MQDIGFGCRWQRRFFFIERATRHRVHHKKGQDRDQKEDNNQTNDTLKQVAGHSFILQKVSVRIEVGWLRQLKGIFPSNCLNQPSQSPVKLYLGILRLKLAASFEMYIEPITLL